MILKNLLRRKKRFLFCFFLWNLYNYYPNNRERRKNITKFIDAPASKKLSFIVPKGSGPNDPTFLLQGGGSCWVSRQGFKKQNKKSRNDLTKKKITFSSHSA